MIISIQTSIPIIHTRLQYVIKVLNNHPWKPKQVSFVFQEQQADLTILYGNDHQVKSADYLRIPAQQSFFIRNVGSSTSPPTWANPYRSDAGTLFSVEHRQRDETAFVQNKEFQFDVFETIFFHLTRWEEVHGDPNHRDQHGMLKEPFHLLVKSGLHRTPVVDHLIRAFYTQLGLQPVLLPAALEISHDVDAILKFPSTYKFVRGLARQLFRGIPTAKLWTYRQQFLDVKRGRISDPYQTWDQLLAARQDVQKYLFVLAGGSTRYEGFYRADDPAMRSIIDQARTLGYEIGLHPSYQTPDRPDMLQREKKTLEEITRQQIVHSRQHFLRFNLLTTPLHLEACGITHDHSMGYQNMTGYRCGTGFTFTWYSLQEDRILSLYEVPFTVMDTALITESGGDDRAMRTIFAALQSNSTPFRLSIHNSSFDPMRKGASTLQQLYDGILLQDSKNPNA